MDQNTEPKINPHRYNQLIFDKGTKAVQCRKDSLFNKWFLINWTSFHGKKKEPKHRTYTFKKLTQNV